MNNFIKKLLFYISFFGILISINFIIVETIYPKIDFSDIYFKFKKINSTDSVDVFIGGDSRAERQIIPKTLSNRFESIEIKNIACGGCEINRFKNFFENYNLNTSDKTLILSTSIFQVNENINYYSPSYSLSSFHSLNISDKFKSFSLKNYSIFSIESHKFLVKEKIKNLFNDYFKFTLSEIPYDIDGFMGIDGVLNTNISLNLDDHPFYKDIEITGVRWTKFKESIIFFSNNFKKTYIIIPPSSIHWKNITKGTIIEESNQNFIRNVKNFIESNNFNNVFLIDSYNDSDLNLQNEHFYDIQHTNQEGADIFTNYLSSQIIF